MKKKGYLTIGRALKYAPSELIKNKKIILTTVLKCASSELRKDCSICCFR